MKIIQSLIFVLLMGTIHSVVANPCPDDNRYAKTPDGCSSWSNNPQQFRDKWGPVNFRPACMAHDRCYYTLGTSEASCNNAFSRNLISACNDGLSVCRNIRGRRVCTPPEPTSFSACSVFAGGMVTLVRAASRSVYRKAQDKQRKHENQCRTNTTTHNTHDNENCRNAQNIVVKVGGISVSFGRNKSWKTCTGYEIIFQRDGNFVVYNPSGRAVFNTGTQGRRGKELVMQTDGNLVIYSDTGEPLWHTHTNGNPGAFLAIQEDGNVVIYDSNRRPIWNAGTNGK